MKKVIYLYKSGNLIRQDASLVLKDKGNNTHYLPIEQIDTIICFSEITLNKRVLSLLNSYEVTILFFNYYGNYIGRFSPKKYVDGKLLIEQINAYQTNEQRLFIAKTMLTASVKNELALLKYYNKKECTLNNGVFEIERLLESFGLAKSIEELMLIEAQIKRVYYNCFDIILCKSDFKFIKRSKQLPENEVNAMLSYGYALLYANYLSVLDRSRLYSQISFIHSLSKNNESLHFDLADILKPVLVDRLILSMCRRKEIKKEYFEYKENRCYLNSVGAKFFVSRYEDYISKTIEIKGRYYSYRNLISREVHLLSNYLSNKENGYKPYVMKW